MFYDNFVYRRDADHAHAATPLWLVTANAKVRVDPVVERHIARKRIRKGARTFVRRDTKYAIRFHRPDSDGRRSVRDVEPPVNREAISGSCGVCVIAMTSAAISCVKSPNVLPPKLRGLHSAE